MGTLDNIKVGINGQGCQLLAGIFQICHEMETGSDSNALKRHKTPDKTFVTYYGFNFLMGEKRLRRFDRAKIEHCYSWHFGPKQCNLEGIKGYRRKEQLMLELRQLIPYRT